MIDIYVFMQEYASCFAEALFAFGCEIAACSAFRQFLFHLGMAIEIIG